MLDVLNQWYYFRVEGDHRDDPVQMLHSTSELTETRFRLGGPITNKYS